MTATKYALVPVVATPKTLALLHMRLGYMRAEDTAAAYTAAIECAAAPKELPEEVVDKMAAAYEAAYHAFPFAFKAGGHVNHDDAHRAGIRAALLAVMGGE